MCATKTTAEIRPSAVTTVTARSSAVHRAAMSESARNVVRCTATADESAAGVAFNPKRGRGVSEGGSSWVTPQAPARAEVGFAACAN